MKKIMGLSVLVILFSLTINAQVKKGNRGENSEFTSEQRATLQAKKMALRLDLDANQQKEIYKVMLKSSEERGSFRTKNMKKRKDGVKPTSEERFNQENTRLEKQLAHKNEIKKILNKEQFEKWEKRMIMSKTKSGQGRDSSKNKMKGKGDCSCNNNFYQSSKQNRNRI
tara:strand:- start:1414 stop:1920 length:507 start_codon:yes stop_codon:yes gene_type:complete